jgi:hypothetical protein
MSLQQSVEAGGGRIKLKFLVAWLLLSLVVK